jgi:hypothetical protein
MRAALILPSQFPNGPKLAKQGVDLTFYPVADPASPALTQAALDERRKYFRVGIMRDPSWDVPYHKIDARLCFDDMTPEQRVAWAKTFAKKFSDDFTRVASPSFFSSAGAPVQCFGMPDIEYHSNLFMVEFFKAFRALRNARTLVWCPESMQGGWMEPDLVALINADPNIIVAKQNYTGAMVEIDGSVSTLDLVKRGLRWERITSMHGLRMKLPPEWWDGILFLESWEQLP